MYEELINELQELVNNTMFGDERNLYIRVLYAIKSQNELLESKEIELENYRRNLGDTRAELQAAEIALEKAQPFIDAEKEGKLVRLPCNGTLVSMVGWPKQPHEENDYD